MYVLFTHIYPKKSTSHAGKYTFSSHEWYVSGQIIIFHQPRVSWNKSICWGFPYYPAIWGEVVWGRYNLTRGL